MVRRSSHWPSVLYWRLSNLWIHIWFCYLPPINFIYLILLKTEIVSGQNQKILVGLKSQKWFNEFFRLHCAIKYGILKSEELNAWLIWLKKSIHQDSCCRCTIWKWAHRRAFLPSRLDLKLFINIRLIFEFWLVK